MSEVIMSWPWYDRMIAGVALAMIVLGPYFIMQRLDRVIKLLERANELELKRQRPDLFD